jgi:membrane protease YdiL (CAAX protease family)
MSTNENNTQRYLNLWAVVLIAWTVYRMNYSFPEYVDEFIAKPIIFLLPVFLYIKNIEKKSFLSGIGFNFKKFIPDLLIGLFVGLFFFSIAVIIKYARTGSLTPNEFAIFGNATSFGYTALVALVTAISEEVLSRGFVLKRLYEDSKNVFSSSFFASILFFILHVPIMFSNSNLSGSYLLFFMTIYLCLGIANSFIFILRKNIVLPILIYAFYSLTISLYF